MHDNLSLSLGVKKGGSYDKTRSACNSKKCPSDIRTFNTYFSKSNVRVEPEVERPLPTFIL